MTKPPSCFPPIDHHAEQERLAAEWWGLRPSRARICLRVVAGKRCLAMHRSCVCDKHRRLLDHGRIWLDEGGKYVLTGEPYGAPATDLLVLIADASELGLEVDLSGRSPWFPGATVLIRIFTPKKSADLDARATGRHRPAEPTLPTPSPEKA